VRLPVVSRWPGVEVASPLGGTRLLRCPLTEWRKTASWQGERGVSMCEGGERVTHQPPPETIPHTPDLGWGRKPQDWRKDLG